MKFLSYRYDNANRIGVLRGQQVADLSAVTGHADLGTALRHLGQEELMAHAAQAAITLPLEAIQSWRPVVADPGAIFCIGLNYEEHRVEAGRAKTAKPTMFLRLASSQLGHMQAIVVPSECPSGLDYEGEIAVVIGRGGRRIAEHAAWSHVLGLSIYNDASARDWQAHSTQWTPGKNFPATGAFGPCLATPDELDIANGLELITRLNGEVMQRADTSMMIFSIPELIAYISTFAELQPGDVIVTGTPGGVGFKRQPPVFMRHGDTAEIEVPGIGTLCNTIVNEQ